MAEPGLELGSSDFVAPSNYPAPGRQVRGAGVGREQGLSRQQRNCPCGECFGANKGFGSPEI